MKKVVLFLFILLIFTSQSLAKTYFTKQVLPSGHEMKIIALTKMFLKDDQTALGLKYETDLDINNVQQLREEAEKIWPFFRPTVEKHEMANAVLIATEPRKYEGIKYTTNNYSFVIIKNENGTWNPFSWGRDYVEESLPLAVNYLKELEQNNLAGTFKYIHNPGKYNESQMKGLVGMLSIVMQELGSVDSHSINKASSNVTYKYIGIQSAMNDYWINFPTFLSIIYDVQFKKEGKGYLVFNFSIVQDSLVLNSVNYSLPAQRADSGKIMEKIQNRILEEVINRLKPKQKP